MAIEKDAEKILEEFSKTLDKVPELEGTYYITDNKDGNIVVKKAEWTG